MLASRTPNELIQHVACDLLDRRTTATNETWVKPGISALYAEGRAIIGAIRSLQACEVVVESPTPLIRAGIENPGATAGLIDRHGPVRSLSKS